MASNNAKLVKSLDTLKQAMSCFKKADNKNIAFLGVAKAFEIAVEYAWRELKTLVENEGLEVQSPKAAVREAARIGIISKAEYWLDFIDARNAGVHDYFGMTDEEYLKIATEFYKEASKVFISR
ncbi:MAG: hypothetical protein COS89_09555 [Deltaproteobacteria bacterium CG07_land_8_20_14_0_80_38_7]|nr:MAG: hypothetical protein COS89_09555 [Deltaproteobacteria bacterium CG07_land_8_20_14_0_80_38_7]